MPASDLLLIWQLDKSARVLITWPAFLFSATTECERQIHIALNFLSPNPEQRPVKRIAQCVLCTTHQTHTASPHTPWSGGWTAFLLPTTSYPVERVALFWLYLSGKWIRGPALSPLLSAVHERSHLLTSSSAPLSGKSDLCWNVLSMAAVRYLLHLLSGCADLGFLTLYIFFLYSKQNNF